ERVKRVVAAFDWQGVVTPANFRLDAWVSPPAYTGKPPVILPGVRPGEQHGQASAALPNAPIAVPAGSVLVIRATGNVQFSVVPSGGVAEAGGPPPQVPTGTEERRYTISGNGSAKVRGVGDEDLVWNFTAIPDRAPTISLAKEPEPQARGALQLVYKI